MEEKETGRDKRKSEDTQPTIDDTNTELKRFKFSKSWSNESINVQRHYHTKRAALFEDLLKVIEQDPDPCILLRCPPSGGKTSVTELAGLNWKDKFNVVVVSMLRCTGSSATFTTDTKLNHDAQVAAFTDWLLSIAKYDKDSVLADKVVSFYDLLKKGTFNNELPIVLFIDEIQQIYNQPFASGLWHVLKQIKEHTGGFDVQAVFGLLVFEPSLIDLEDCENTPLLFKDSRKMDSTFLYFREDETRELFLDFNETNPHIPKMHIDADAVSEIHANTNGLALEIHAKTNGFCGLVGAIGCLLEEVYCEDGRVTLQMWECDFVFAHLHKIVTDVRCVINLVSYLNDVNLTGILISLIDSPPQLVDSTQNNVKTLINDGVLSVVEQPGILPLNRQYVQFSCDTMVFIMVGLVAH
eukprot:TRINITY_DN3512_c0_g1_i3.p1 TRINITY_DN3512_c0_g1~~TRINITY_DN3512_c0_g1_i3.p1  ORF type:complete len:411 (-),score=52.96 TRINITY_DN3512_c0_g1_i3:102-1334(-)